MTLCFSKLSLLSGGGTFPRNNLFPPFQKSLATSGRRRRAKQNILISSIAAAAFYSYINANMKANLTKSKEEFIKNLGIINFRDYKSHLQITDIVLIIRVKVFVVETRY